jgi:hypothetical protein
MILSLARSGRFGVAGLRTEILTGNGGIEEVLAFGFLRGRRREGFVEARRKYWMRLFITLLQFVAEGSDRFRGL